MRHRISGRKLNRDSQHRQALFTNLVVALIEHGEIKTTLAKAKSVQALMDKLMTKAKGATLADRRNIAKTLNKRALVNRLVDEVAPHSAKRSSGFTRIVRLGVRRGDDAMMVRLSLVDKPAVAPVAVAPAKEEAKPAKKTEKVTTKKPTVAVQKAARPTANVSAVTAKVAKKRGDK